MNTSIAIISPGILPVPAVQGGAVEELITKIIYQNEKSESFHIDLITLEDKRLQNVSFKYTNIITIKKPKWVSLADRVIDKWYRMRKLDKCFRFWDYVMLKKLNPKDYEIILIENMLSIYKAGKKKFAGKKVYFHMHNNIDAYRNRKDIEAFTKAGGHIITVSSYLQNAVKTVCPKADVQTLLNCVNTDVFRSITYEDRMVLRKSHLFNDKDFVFLYSGRLIPEKGVLELLEAFLKVSLSYPHSRLLITGCALFQKSKKTDYERRIEELASKTYHIIFTGFVPPDKMPEVYACADAVVIPSRWEEPFGMVALEALSMHIPIIATMSGGLAEILDDQCAIIIPNDHEISHNLMVAMEQLLQMSKQNYTQMIKSAETRMEEHLEFSEKGYLQRLVEIICRK